MILAAGAEKAINKTHTHTTVLTSKGALWEAQKCSISLHIGKERDNERKRKKQEGRRDRGSGIRRLR